MRLITLCAIVLVALGTYQIEFVPELGSKLPARMVPKDNRSYYMTAPSQLRPYIIRTINQIKYYIAYDEKTREVKYLYTDDEHFKSSRGRRVGDFIELKGNKLGIFPGWEIRAPEEEKDGWQPLVGFDSKLTVLEGQKETELKVKPDQYSLPADQTLKVKIIGFVRGSN